MLGLRGWLLRPSAALLAPRAAPPRHRLYLRMFTDNNGLQPQESDRSFLTTAVPCLAEVRSGTLLFRMSGGASGLCQPLPPGTAREVARPCREAEFLGKMEAFIQTHPLAFRQVEFPQNLWRDRGWTV